MVYQVSRNPQAGFYNRNTLHKKIIHSN